MCNLSRHRIHTVKASHEGRNMEKDSVKEEKDILEVLESYIPSNDPRKWAKLTSTISYRRLVLSLLKEILVELRKLNQK
jgi:hypothetical protein